MNAHLPIGGIHIFLCSFLFRRMSKLFIPFPFLLCNYMRLSSARQMHTNPSIPVIPPAVKAILSTAFTAIITHTAGQQAGNHHRRCQSLPFHLPSLLLSMKGNEAFSSFPSNPKGMSLALFFRRLPAILLVGRFSPTIKQLPHLLLLQIPDMMNLSSFSIGKEP